MTKRQTPAVPAPAPFSPATRTRPGVPAPDLDGRVVSTGFAALDAVLGTGGLPRSATVALRGDASSGKTTVALRVAAEAQAGGAIVAWLDLARAFDPVEAVARGISPEWLVVLTPADLEEALVAGRVAARRPDRGPAGPGPAGRAGSRGCREAGGGPAGPARGAGQARRDAARRAGAGRAGPDARRGRGGGERPAAGAAAIGLDPPRAGRGGAAQRGHRRAQPLRAARPSRGARDPVRGGRPQGRLPAPAGSPGRARRADTPGRAHRAGRPAGARRRPAAPHPPERPPSIGRSHAPAVPALATPAPPPGEGPDGGAREAGEPQPVGAPDGTISGSWPHGPIVLGGQPWTDGTVVDADPLARALGVRRGIPLGTAHRLAPEATFLDLAPDADRDALEAACERLASFSPGIAASSDVRDPSFGRIAVHADGLMRLWGVEERLVVRMDRGPGARPPGAAPGGDRRDGLRRGRRRGAQPRGSAPHPRPARRRRAVPRPVSRPPPHAGRGHPGAPRPVRAADDRVRGGAASLGGDRAVRGRGGQAPCAGQGRGDGALPPTESPGADGAGPAAGPAGRGPRGAALRAPPAGGRAGRPAGGAGPGRGSRPPRGDARPRVRPPRDPGRAPPRAALPGAHR